MRSLVRPGDEFDMQGLKPRILRGRYGTANHPVAPTSGAPGTPVKPCPDTKL